MRGLYLRVVGFIGLVNYECHSQNEVGNIGIFVLWRAFRKILNAPALVLLPTSRALLSLPFYRPPNKPVVDPSAINTVYLPLCLTRSNLHCPGGYLLNVDELLGRAEILFHPVLQTMWILQWILFSCMMVKG